MANEEWRSPRRIEEDIAQYRRHRFESLMQDVDSGKTTLELAINGLREEIAGEIDLGDMNERIRVGSE